MEALMQLELSRGLATFFDGVAKAAARSMAVLSAQREFSCGDCERNASCGLPPNEFCVIKAMQLERDADWRPRRSPIGY
jgi:hypothetical protein